MPSFSEIYEANKDNLAKVIDSFKDTNADRAPEDYLKEYKGKRERRPLSVGNRLDKMVGEAGNQKSIPVARLSYAFPKKIVRAGVAFSVGGEMNISGNEQDEALDAFKTTWNDVLKMPSVIKKFVRTLMVETKVALLFYPIQKEGEPESKLRVKILDFNSGDFFPHFDDYGDMDAFIWKRTGTSMEGKEVEQVDIYTETQYIFLEKGDGGWLPKATKDGTGTRANPFLKIPIVYAEQEVPEWEDVVSLMDEFETRVSRLADTNDYFSEPMVLLYGKPSGLPDKGTVGKLLQFEMKESLDGKTSHGDAKYLTWDQTPEAIKLELETTWNGIFSMSSTPDLSFDNLKGIGNVSGVAMRLMFLDAMLKAQERDDIPDAVQRMVSVVKAGISQITNVKFSKKLEENKISASFGSVLPDNITELLEMLGKAKQDGIISTETAVSHNPLVSDSQEENERITKEDENERSKQGEGLMGSFG